MNFDGRLQKLVLGFCFGAKIDPDNYILKGDLEQVRQFWIDSVQDLHDENLHAMIMEAIAFADQNF